MTGWISISSTPSNILFEVLFGDFFFVLVSLFDAEKNGFNWRSLNFFKWTESHRMEFDVRFLDRDFSLFYLCSPVSASVCTFSKRNVEGKVREDNVP